MENILFVNANPKQEDHSYTLRLADCFINAYQSVHPDAAINRLNLFEADIPLIDARVLKVWEKTASGESISDEEKTLLQKIDTLTTQFIAADKVIIAAPMWNFLFPPLVKAYIDTVLISGKTFRYTNEGSIGLLKDKPVLLIQARGGIYSEGPAQAFDHAIPYLRTVLQFIGIRNFQTLLCEGVNQDPAKAGEILETAKDSARRLAQQF